MQQQMQYEGQRLAIRGIPIYMKFNLKGAHTGSNNWNASYITMRLIDSHYYNQFTGRKCLDLSGGPGVLAIALTKIGLDFEQCDIPETIEMAEINFELNQVSIPQFPYQWGNESEQMKEKMQDWVVMSDLLFCCKDQPVFYKIFDMVLSQNKNAKIMFIWEEREPNIEIEFRNYVEANQTHDKINQDILNFEDIESDGGELFDLFYIKPDIIGYVFYN